MKKATMKEVAQLAGVSSSTVSRVINNSAPVNEELRKKVLSIIEKTRYFPDQTARSLKKGKTNIIGVIIPDITNPFFPAIIKGAEDYLRKHGFIIMLGNSDFKLSMEKKLFYTFETKNVDGFLFIGIGSKKTPIENFDSVKNIVFLDRLYDNISKNYVIVDNIQGMKDLVEYLISLNHKSFVLITGKKNTYTAEERKKGFEIAMKKNGVSDFRIYYSDFSYEKGYQTAKKLTNLPDAIVCGDDIIAYGVIDALNQRKILVPEDVSVTGFDDLPYSSKLSIALTTIKQPIYDLGYEGAKLLLKILTGKKTKRNQIALQTELIKRSSTIYRKD